MGMATAFYTHNQHGFGEDIGRNQANQHWEEIGFGAKGVGGFGDGFISIFRCGFRNSVFILPYNAHVVLRVPKWIEVYAALRGYVM